MRLTTLVLAMMSLSGAANAALPDYAATLAAIADDIARLKPELRRQRVRRIADARS